MMNTMPRYVAVAGFMSLTLHPKALAQGIVDEPVAIRMESTQSRKSPMLASALSLAFPGGGQMYNGHWRKAAVFGGAEAVGFAMFLGGALNCTAEDEDSCVSAVAGLVLGLGALAWSVVDAPLSARAINRQRGIGAIELRPRLHRLARSQNEARAQSALGAWYTHTPTWGVTIASLRF